MSDNGVELHRIAWTETFPFVRLFGTARMALGFKRLALALVAVLLVYCGGRTLDWMWGGRRPVLQRAVSEQYGLQVAGLTNLTGNAGELDDTTHDALRAYATLSQYEYKNWSKRAAIARRDLGVQIIVQEQKAADRVSAEKLLAEHGGDLRAIVADEAYRKNLEELRALIRDRVLKGREAIAAEKISEDAMEARITALRVAANAFLVVLSEDLPRHWRPARVNYQANVGQIAKADPAVEPSQQRVDETRIMDAMRRQIALHRYEQLAPRGIFASLMDFEAHCVAAAIQGACAGRLGFAGHAFAAEPSLAGSLLSALRGLCWFGTHDRLYALLFLVWSLLVSALFGGAVCRSAAVEATRGESIRAFEALKFARQKYWSLLAAPLIPLGICIVIAIPLLLGGLFTAIPWFGDFFGGLLYGLALLGGFAIGVVALLGLFGFPLMWPTITVEGSEGTDALMRSFNYTGARIWHYGFYTLVLCVYGAFSFVIVRIVAAAGLKLTHTITGLWLNPCTNGAGYFDAGKLNVVWHMPSWADFSWLPSTGEMPFWGRLGYMPTGSFNEWMLKVFLAIWVYLVVGLVAAYLVNFFLCGSTQMYILLRRSVDATDWEEVYYEEPETEEPEPLPAPVSPAPPAANDAASPPVDEPPAAPPNDEAPPA